MQMWSTKDTKGTKGLNHRPMQSCPRNTRNRTEKEQDAKPVEWIGSATVSTKKERRLPDPAKPEPNGERTRPRVQFLTTRQKLLKYNAKHHAVGEMEATPYDLEVFGESPKTAYGVAFSPALLTSTISFLLLGAPYADASRAQTSSKTCSLLSSQVLNP